MGPADNNQILKPRWCGMAPPALGWLVLATVRTEPSSLLPTRPLATCKYKAPNTRARSGVSNDMVSIIRGMVTDVVIIYRNGQKPFDDAASNGTCDDT
jgi:hypothetical protein